MSNAPGPNPVGMPDMLLTGNIFQLETVIKAKFAYCDYSTTEPMATLELKSAPLRSVEQ